MTLTVDLIWYIIPSVKGILIQHIKVREDNGNIIEVKLWKVLPSPDKPHGYKYSLAYVVKDNRVIGYDNGEGQGDHRHYGDSIDRYEFKTVWKLIADFFKDIESYKRRKS